MAAVEPSSAAGGAAAVGTGQVDHTGDRSVPFDASPQGSSWCCCWRGRSVIEQRREDAAQERKTSAAQEPASQGAGRKAMGPWVTSALFPLAIAAIGSAFLIAYAAALPLTTASIIMMSVGGVAGTGATVTTIVLILSGRPYLSCCCCRQ